MKTIIEKDRIKLKIKYNNKNFLSFSRRITKGTYSVYIVDKRLDNLLTDLGFIIFLHRFNKNKKRIIVICEDIIEKDDKTHFIFEVDQELLSEFKKNIKEAKVKDAIKDKELEIINIT